MRYRFSVLLAAAALALAGLIAGGVGSAGASPMTPSITTSPPLTPPPTCPPVLPLTGHESAVTATSVTFDYLISLAPPCGFNPPVTVTLFASREDALQWHNPVAEAVSGPERFGKVTVNGLAADTVYWYRFSADGRRDTYVLGSARTAPAPVCAATVAIGHRWSGGFVATVTVRNVGTDTLDGWRVAWRWSADERILTVWNATVEGGGGPDVTVRNASYNGALAPGRSTTFGMLVAASAPPGAIVPTCP